VTDNSELLLPDLTKDPFFEENNRPNADSRKSRAIAEFLSRDVAARAQSAEEIACMANSYLLAPQEVREDKVISVADINEPASNAFRELRRNVFEYTGRLNPIVLVTGVQHDVGSSLVAKNLAAAIALDETSTSLFIDCNIRMSQEGDQAHVGLTDFLESDEIDESEIIQHTGIPRLRSIGPGRQRELAGEYFSSPRIRSLLTSVSTRYPDRSVVIDAPPASTDAAILADLCDVVLLVVAYGRNTEKQIGKAIGILGRDKIMGFVFNDQPHVPEYEW
jgi:Mrp family chromosome partitioning ATPase